MIGSFRRYIWTIFISILTFIGSLVITLIFNQTLNDKLDKIKCVVLGIMLVTLIVHFNFIAIKINIFSFKNMIDSRKSHFFIFWIFMSFIAIVIEILLLIWTIYILKYGTFNIKTKGMYNSGWAWNNFAAAKAFVLGDYSYSIILGKIPVTFFWISFYLILIWTVFIIGFKIKIKSFY